MPDQKLTVLMIDDNPADAAVVRRQLSKLQDLNIELLHCSTGEKGIQTLARREVDCVFLDHLLGSITGLEVLEMIRTSGNDVPVIMLTSQSDEMIAVESMKRGAQDYIPKGRVTPQALRRILVTSLERVSLQRRLDGRREELEVLGFSTANSLRAPVALMSDLVGRLREELSGRATQETDECLETMGARIDEMSHIIEGVLEHTRCGHIEGPFAELDIKGMVDELVGELGARLDKVGAEVETGFLPRIQGDRDGIRRVLRNLLTNAIEFRGDSPPRIQVYAHLEHDCWYFTMQDNGIDIEAKDHELVFRPLPHLSPEVRHRGHGIRLATCRKIIEQHKGRIWVQSEPGRGTAFRFTLPAPSWRGSQVPRAVAG